MIKLLYRKCTICLKKAQALALDGLFPIRCLGCNMLDHWICPQCHSALPIVTEQACPKCKKHTTNNGEMCPSCINVSVKEQCLDGVFIASHYHDTLLKKAIHYYKYRFVYALSKPLALLLAQSLYNATFPAPDIIIPVPLHKRRLRWRGFNQTELLAQELDLRIPIYTDILKRVRYTKPQARTKNKKCRQKNLERAFSVQHTDRIKQKNILLIDDVMTTGATLEECAITLKKSGAKKVHCLVIARE